MVHFETFLNLFGIVAMVAKDTGSPDPDNPENDLTMSNEGIVIVTEDDDDESDDQDTIILDDYQPLAMDETSDSLNASSEDESPDIDNTIGTSSANSGHLPVPPIIPIEQTLVQEVWTTSLPQDIEMDSKKVDEVKEAMVNFTLPPSSIPEWAVNIPEEEWKQQLMKRLQTMKENSS